MLPKENGFFSYGDALNRWQNKPYYSLNTYLKERFGTKIRKLPLNGGFTCPNRDGTLGVGGCIFCSNEGSGDFALNTLPEADANGPFIAYFQSYTNTYAPVDVLKKQFMTAILHPQTAVLAIATRPDCLPLEVIDLLQELNQIKPVWVELGLQTIHESTASFIRRGYTLDVFEDAVQRLHTAGIETIVHTILGLPAESFDMILDTHRFLSKLPISGIKIQLLHVLKGTDLDKIYASDPFHVLTLEEYTDLLIRCIELLPPTMVIHRITGDGPKHLLTAPLWSGYKKNVLNHIHHEFKIRQTWQGRMYERKGNFL